MEGGTGLRPLRNPRRPGKSPADHPGSRYAGWTGPEPGNPERGGQTYLEGSNQKIAGLRSLLDRVGSRAVIQIDGGVTPQNLPEAYAAGARSVVAGSAVLAGPSSPEWLTCGGAVRSDIEENRSSPISDLE